MSELKGCYRVALAALDTGGGVVGLANPEGVDLIVTKLIVVISVVATAACTIDGGIAAGITTTSDNLIDAADVNGALGDFDNIDDAGSNGKATQSWDSDEFLTISMKTGAAAGLAGYAYIEYIRA